VTRRPPDATEETKYDAAAAILANLPSPDGEPDDYWEKNLELSDKQKIVASLRNVFMILMRDRAGRACWPSTSSPTRW
jgi:hypothetical protein